MLDHAGQRAFPALPSIPSFGPKLIAFVDGLATSARALLPPALTPRQQGISLEAALARGGPLDAPKESADTGPEEPGSPMTAGNAGGGRDKGAE
jgi:hypothetical protein